MGLRSCAGQERVADILLGALLRGRLAQTYLFAGPEGSGKRRMAVELAKAALCDGRGESRTLSPDACGSCASCLAVEGRRHPDVELFQPEKGKTSYPVKQVREEIRQRAYLKPSLGAGRFLIIDRAEALVRGGGQNEGADTLLKLLEEPPPATTLVLLASHAERLPDTVRSRCQTVRFEQPDPVDLARVVSEEAGLEKSEALFLVRLTGGDLTMARGFLAAKKKDRPDLVRLRDTLLTVVRSGARLTYPDLFLLAAELDGAARGWPALTGALGVLTSLYRDAALQATLRDSGGTVSLTFPSGPEAEATQAAASETTTVLLTQAARRVLAAQEDSRRYPARLLLLEALLLDLVGLFEGS